MNDSTEDSLYSPLLFSYPSIFAYSVDDAATNLIRLLTTGDCGYDAGISTYQSYMRRLLSSDLELQALREYAPQFTVEEWRQIIQTVLNRVDLPHDDSCK